MKKYILFTLLFALVVTSCRKEIDSVDVNETPHTPILLDDYTPIVANVTASVYGTVVDEAGEPIVDATVNMGTVNTTTDAFGSFSFNNEIMNAKGTFIHIKKTGYFESGRRFFPRENDSNEIRVALLPLTFDQSFESTAGGTLTIPDGGGTIVFLANSIQTESGSAYSGIVNAAVRYLDPTAFSTFDQMPGALQGVNRENEEGGLRTYGMVAVELTDAAGEKLNIAEGFTATLNVNLPQSLQANAPTEIPLWSFNYTYGIWVEESRATLENGIYTGEVSHFSFWNCDFFDKTIDFEITVLDETFMEPLRGIGVRIGLTSGASSGYGITNLNGRVAGMLPVDETLVLEILDPCGDILYTENIGPFVNDVSLGPITAGQVVKITGSILNCDNEIAEMGIINTVCEGRYYSVPLQSNPFSLKIPVCASSTELQVTAGDRTTLQQGAAQTFAVQNEINAGEMVACGEELLGYCKITVNNTVRYMLIRNTRQIPDTINPYVTYIDMFGQPDVPEGELLRAQFGITANPGPGFSTGDYTTGNFNDILEDTENNWNFTDPFDTFIIDEHGPYFGTIISGYASGMMMNNALEPAEEQFVEMEFRTIRVQE